MTYRPMKCCKECQKLLPLDSYAMNQQYRDKKDPRCKDCYNRRQRARKRVPDEKLKYRRPTRSSDGISKQAKVAYIQELKTAPCTCCGTYEPPPSMDFHHLDETTKEFSLGKISTSRGGIFTLEQIKKEIAKCILICANCHRKLHSNLLCLVPA